jgi:hypothetical protein
MGAQARQRLQRRWGLDQMDAGKAGEMHGENPIAWREINTAGGGLTVKYLAAPDIPR